MATTTERKQRTITLTGRAPVRIYEAEWPTIARAEWGDDARIPSQSNRGASIRVRRHADGRAVVYATTWSQWQGEGSWAGGELLAAGADIATAIRRVADDGAISESAIRECIADLPAEVL